MSIRSLLQHVGIKVGPTIRVNGEVIDHEYLSTGCLHGEHGYCQYEARRYDGSTKTPAQCKFCAAPCVCACHKEQT
ncbi:hypothetical protein [Streptomyces sp. NPDC046925]|uniref:hypothetical protein n=1 Tax=Streptomyces sp. NPDC046925 TaxID=3155375 RepID=UPI0033F20F7C